MVSRANRDYKDNDNNNSTHGKAQPLEGSALKNRSGSA